MFDDALNTTIAGARSHTIGDLFRRSALRYPNRPALVFAGDTRTYAELDDYVNRVANALTERGVLPRSGSRPQEPRTQTPHRDDRRMIGPTPSSSTGSRLITQDQHPPEASASVA